MFNDEGKITVKAAEKLETKRRVKVDTSATTASPVKVVYADAGEDFLGVTERSGATGDLIGVKLQSAPGTFEMEAVISSAINVGTTLYGAADCKVSDASSGSAQGEAMQKASASNDHIRVHLWNVKSTTAATVSVADSGAFTDETTVEAALAEIYQHIATTQAHIGIPLTDLCEAVAFAIPASNANMGILGLDTSPSLSSVEGATDECMGVTWATGDVDQVIANVLLPSDMNKAADLVVHARLAAGGAVDTPSFTLESYFNEGDTVVSDTLTAGGATSDYAEVTQAIAASDVPADAQVVTLGFTPASHDTDAFKMTALWMEYTRRTLAT